MSPGAQPPPGRGRRQQDSNRGGDSSGAKRSRYTPGPVDPEYDDLIGDAEGWESDPLTADHWAAICRDAERGLLEEAES